MSSNSDRGVAREMAPGRLANFEDSEDDMGASLPPRPRGNRKSARSRAQEKQQTPPPQSDDTPSAAPESPPEAPAQNDNGPKGAKGPEDRVRPSNVHIPIGLLEPLTAKCRAEGMSHGEVIITAIEHAHPRLTDLIHPAATAGGSLFASRRSRASRAGDGPLTPLNYRLREGDFQTLDQLVEEFGASSRGHLITAALTDYFHT